MKSLFCIGHRGASGEEPENTIRAIVRALELGAEGIEIDVRVTRDGELVVIHDATVERTTDGVGAVEAMTLEELRALDAGKGEKIPTLREVIQVVSGRAWLNIELKAKGTAARALREICQAVEECGVRREDFTISSFDHEELALAAEGEAGPSVPIGLLLGRWPLGLVRLVQRVRASSLHVPARWVSPRRMVLAKALGLRVLVYTVNDPAEMTRLQCLGVDGVFTDFPDRVQKNGV